MYETTVNFQHFIIVETKKILNNTAGIDVKFLLAIKGNPTFPGKR